MAEINSHNPFDQTIWDPIDPEHAIEDPFHGPEAVTGLLSIPPYLNDDGTYYVFGGSYLCGTCTFDSEGKPFIEFRADINPRFMREVQEHRQWVEAFHAGELPPREEMGYPEFQFNKQPYFKFKAPS
jgi:hypothetical protein